MPAIDAVEETLDELEALLRRQGVEIAPGSRLQEALLFARQVRYVQRAEAQIQEADDRPLWREMHGIFDLAVRLRRAEADSPTKFEALRPWLRLFASSRGQLAQTAPTTAGDQDSDKVFELLVGLALLPHIDGLEPDRATGTNPDLLFNFAGRSWGIACKRLYSTRPAAFRDTVTKAISQIERSPAEVGLVFVSLVNVMQHDLFWPMEGDNYVGLSGGAMREVLEQEKTRLADETLAFSDDDLAGVFEGAKAMPGVVHYLGTTYLTGSPDAPEQRTVQHAWSRGVVNELLELFQDGLNSTSSNWRSAR
ncbi:MAG: hypothetical protein KA297_00450 [Kofleriaceae bacterium]|nr:hypothetical protein [Kofleriaceae bacterium]